MWLFQMEAEVPIYPQRVAHFNFEKPRKTDVCYPNLYRLNCLDHRQCRPPKGVESPGLIAPGSRGCFLGKVVVSRDNIDPQTVIIHPR
jgi:hypothetical protein